PPPREWLRHRVDAHAAPEPRAGRGRREGIASRRATVAPGGGGGGGPAPPPRPPVAASLAGGRYDSLSRARGGAATVAPGRGAAPRLAADRGRALGFGPGVGERVPRSVGGGVCRAADGSGHGPPRRAGGIRARWSRPREAGDVGDRAPGAPREDRDVRRRGGGGPPRPRRVRHRGRPGPRGPRA